MKKLPWLLLVFFSFTSMAICAQEIESDTIEKNKKIDVVRVYEQMALDGSSSPYMYRELAYYYYFRNDYDIAKTWFEKLFEAEEQSDKKVKHRYRQTLKALSLDYKDNPYLVRTSAN